MPIVIKPEDVFKAVSSLPAEESNARNYFKNTNNRNSTQIAVADIVSTVGNIPVIGRGTTGYRPMMKGSIQSITPMAVEIDDYFSATEAEDFERSSNIGKQQLVQERIKRWALLVRNTTKALCAQSHRGSIDYMMQAGSDMVRYEVDYGTVKGINLTELSTLTVGGLLEVLNTLASIPAENGVGGAVEFVAGGDVMMRIITIITGQNNLPIVNIPGGIEWAGFKILRDNDSYVDKAEDGTESTKKMLGTKELLVRALNGGQSLEFCRIDDTIMREAMPLYAFTKERADQRGTDLFVKSKPFPLVNTKAVAIGLFA